MQVTWKNGNLLVEPAGVSVENFPLDWIDGFSSKTLDEISMTLFSKSYGEVKTWRFRTDSVEKTRIENAHYTRREYAWRHLCRDGVIRLQSGKQSVFWRGIYYPDLGIYGRLGGATSRGVGSGSHPNFLSAVETIGRPNLTAKDTVMELILASINLVFPHTLVAPVPIITLDHLDQNGIKAIFTVGGPDGGQPLPPDTIGIGTLSSLGSPWYNHPEPYENPYHAPGERFFLLPEVKKADFHPAVIAIQQQDEPAYTSVYEDRFHLIKANTGKAVFCTYNWGAFYDAASPLYKLVRGKRIRPIANVTDIYCSDLYGYTPEETSSFREFGPHRETVWTLVDRHRAEVEELSAELGRPFYKPRWLVLQGYGRATKNRPDQPIVPDPQYMFAQIWAAVCLGCTGVAIYLQHTAGSEASNARLRAKDPKAPLIEGIAPGGTNADVWQAMADAYKLIERYEPILLEESIGVNLSEPKKVLTLLKQKGATFYIFALNCYREKITTEIFFYLLPGKNWRWRNGRSATKEFHTVEGPGTFSFEPFELKIFEVERVDLEPPSSPTDLKLGQ